ncbi:MAG TPA: DUF4233 domain-containing protein [Pilimelia sp.]|nr:DUF4233 domain-containing protein [Pilimelia sp.]
MTGPGEPRIGPGEPGTGPGEPGRPGQSGLRDPAAAVRGMGAGTLVLEAVVLLLAIQPLRILGTGFGGAAVAVVCALAAAALLLAGLMRHRRAWPAAGVLQALLLAAGLLHWSLAVLGVVFGLVWAYVLHVRRAILG